MELGVLVLLLMPLAFIKANDPAPKPYVMWDDRSATIEYTEDITNQCFSIDVIPGLDPKCNMTGMIENICEILKSEFQFGSETQRDYAKRNCMKRNGYKLRELINLDELTESNFGDLLSVLNWRPTELLKTFGYPDNFEYGAWLAVDHKHLECADDNQLELFVCGQVNKNRRLGKLKQTIPLGTFSSRGTIYKFRNIPQWAVKVGDEIVSADSCKPLKTLVQCKTTRTNKCSYTNYENCDQVAIFSPNQTAARYLDGEVVVVAANTTEYELVINGKHDTHNMVNSKHVFMVASPEDYMVVNDVVIYGNASYSDFVFAIPGEPENLTVTHEDLDKLSSYIGENEEIAEHRKLLPPRELHIIHYIKKYILLGLLVLIASSAIITTIIYFVCRKTPRQPADEPSVRFAGDDKVEIVY